MVQIVLEGLECNTGLRHPATGKLHINSAVNRYMPRFEAGKYKVAKGEGWNPPFMCITFCTDFNDT